MGITDVMLKSETFTVVRDDFIIQIDGVKHNNQIDFKDEVYQNEIITDELKNQFIIKNVTFTDIFKAFPYTAQIQTYFNTNPTFNNITNSAIIFNSPNSNITQNISFLPQELQPMAIELYNCLIEMLKTKIKPKTFKERFGDFIVNNADKLAFLGKLALEILIAVP